MGAAKERGDKVFVGDVKFNAAVQFVVPPTGIPAGSVPDPLLLSSGIVTAPTYSFTSDPDTGPFNPAADELGFAVGGVNGLSLRELNSGVVQAPFSTLGITAFATGGQTDAVALIASYNVLGTVATAGDSVKLPAVFNVNSIVYVKNDGAESADIFPATGDDLGQGADTAVAIASGASRAFIATAANSTWTELLVSGGVSFPILADAGAVGAPSYSFVGTPDSGVYNRAGDEVNISSNGFECVRILGTSSLVRQTNLAPAGLTGTDSQPSLGFGATGDTGIFESGNNVLGFTLAAALSWTMSAAQFSSNTGGGPKMMDEVGSLTNPTFVPNGNDVDTGLGGDGGDILALVAGGVSGIQVSEAAGLITIPTFGPIRAPDGTNALPSYSFSASPTSGIYSSAANRIAIATAGVGQFQFRGINFEGLAGNSPVIFNEASTITNPTLTPHGGDPGTGIGGTGSNLSLIASGVEALRVVNEPGIDQIIIYPAGVSDVLTPALAFGDGDTGFFESADDTLEVSVAAASRFKFAVNVFGADQAAGPAMLNEDASSTNPTLIPNQADDDTGLGRDAVDGLALIAGGLSCLRVREIGAARAVGLYTTTPIVQQTGVAVSAAGIHAALVNLGAFTA